VNAQANKAIVVDSEAIAAATPKQVTGRKFTWTPYLFILPHLIFFGLFLAWPFFFGIFTSLFEFDFLRPERRPFVGLENYLDLFNPTTVQSKNFWRSMRNTVEFILWSVPVLVVLAVFLAVLLNNRFRGRGFFRLLFFAPYTLSVTAAAIVWWWLFQNQGLVNRTLVSLGMEPHSWLSTMPDAWFAITIATVWWTIGFNTIIILAALQDIPMSLYEAAAIDGAGSVRRFWSITLPMLRPVLVFVVTITLLASANLFGQPLIMTAGGPVQRTETIIYEIYQEGIIRAQMGSAAAMSIIVATILIVLTALNFRFFGRSETE
jgi:multiple sugar transport system permease protein